MMKKTLSKAEIAQLYKENFFHSTPEEIEEMNETVSLVEAIRDSSPELQAVVRKLLELAPRASSCGFGIEFDKTTRSFFISNLNTNTVAVPPPMNLSMVEEWLDDHNA